MDMGEKISEYGRRWCSTARRIMAEAERFSCCAVSFHWYQSARFTRSTMVLSQRVIFRYPARSIVTELSELSASQPGTQGHWELGGAADGAGAAVSAHASHAALAGAHAVHPAPPERVVTADVAAAILQHAIPADDSPACAYLGPRSALAPTCRRRCNGCRWAYGRTCRHGPARMAARAAPNATP